MAKLNRGSCGCRAVVMAGRYLSGPSPLPLSRGLCAVQRRMVSSDSAGTGRRAEAVAQQESPGTFSGLQANRNLIYRDVKAFLSEVGGDPQEARYWLTQFQRAASAQSPAFAVFEVTHGLVSLSELTTKTCLLLKKSYQTFSFPRGGGQRGVKMSRFQLPGTLNWLICVWACDAQREGEGESATPPDYTR